MKIYNSLTRTKEEFAPISKGRVGIYVCGPTVYDEPHIGHARSAYIFDVIRRYLEYKDYKVKFVRNVTDVDDKIIDKAKKEKLEAREIAKKYLDAYHEDMALLGIGKPDNEPKATEYIPDMIKFINLLIKKGCAYESDGDVYFDIKKASSYGKLSNQNLEKMEAGARITPGEKKRDPLDFALWKKAKEDEPSWKSPWSAGRPGWHVECSVMSSRLLGNEFDLHGGGIDLIFPHHENEIAQSEGAGDKFARMWMHNGLLTINGEKMAKSLGNFISIKDFIAKYKDADYLKLLFLNTHYRHPVDYTEEKIAEMKAQKERFVILMEKIDRMSGDRGSGIGNRTSHEPRTTDPEIAAFKRRFEQAMDDDFNMPLALAGLFEMVNFVNKNIDDARIALRAKKMLLELTGIFAIDLEKNVVEQLPAAVDKLIRERDEARAKKDYKKSDEIRKKLATMGIILEDTKEGTVWRRSA